MDHRVREVERGLGQADVLDGVGGRVRDHERLRVGEADVFRREDDEPAGDETRVFSCFEHPREPVDARVGIGTADRLDERRHDVVVLVVAVVDAAQRERGFRVLERDLPVPPLHREGVRDFEDGQQVPGIALAPARPGGRARRLRYRWLRHRGRVHGRRAHGARARGGRRRRGTRAGTVCCARGAGP